jgi:hypothetical protein
MNMLVMANILFYKKSRHMTQSGNSIEAQVSVPTQMQNLTRLGWEISYTNSNNVHLRSLDADFWRTVGEMAM